MTGACIDPFGSMAPFCLYSLVASLMVHISASVSFSLLYKLKKNWAVQVSILWGCQEHNVLYICMILTVVNIWYTFNMTIFFHSYIQQVNVLDSIYYHEVWGDADKSLAQATSRCFRTELIVSLERGSIHVPNCKSFLVTEAERKHVTWRARFQQHGDMSCQVFFSPARQGTDGNLCHSDRNIRGTCTIVCHCQKLSGPV